MEKLLILLMGVGALLLVLILYHYLTGNHINKLLASLFIIYALILGVMGGAVLNQYDPIQWRYDVGLILVDNFVGAILFGLIILVLNKLKDSFFD